MYYITKTNLSQIIKTVPYIPSPKGRSFTAHFIRAILVGAKDIILVHNHPSGDLTVSEEDIAITHRIKEAGELIRIKLLDHIIVGRGRFVSIREDWGCSW